MIFGATRVAPEKAVFRPALSLSVSPEFTGEHAMAKSTYSELLKDPRWQRKRLEIMQRDSFACQLCYDTETTLHVHHKRYVKGRMPWEYEAHELVTLCWPCHEEAHEFDAAAKEILARLPLDGPACLHNAMGLIAGWADCRQGMDFLPMVDREPFHFFLGQVAQALGERVVIQHLVELSMALEQAPTWVVRPAIDALLKTLQERKDDPVPEGWQSGLLEDPL